MSREAVDKIKEAESAANAKKLAAVERARAITAEASERGKREYDEAVAAAQRDMADKLALITTQSEALLLKNKTEAEAEAEAETERAAEQMEDAVAIIIGEIAKYAGK